MEYTYITHKKNMLTTSFTYRSCLEIVTKKSLAQIAATLNIPFAKTAAKDVMVDAIESFVKSNPAKVLEMLCVKELELVRDLVRAGADMHIAKAPRRTHDTIKMLLLVSVCYDKKTRKEHLQMADELRDLFASHIDAVLKKARKKDRESTLCVTPPTAYDEYMEGISDLPNINEFFLLQSTLDDMISRYKEEYDGRKVEDAEWEDEGCDGESEEPEEGLEIPPTKSKYSSSRELVEDVRKLYFTKKLRVFRLFYRLLNADAFWSDSFFSLRFYETFRNINVIDGEICIEDDSLMWLGYAVNDFSNAISDIDYHDPMTFFRMARKIEGLLVKMENEG